MEGPRSRIPHHPFPRLPSPGSGPDHTADAAVAFPIHFARICLQGGQGIPPVREWLGHSEIETIMSWSHVPNPCTPGCQQPGRLVVKPDSGLTAVSGRRLRLGPRPSWGLRRSPYCGPTRRARGEPISAILQWSPNSIMLMEHFLEHQADSSIGS